MVGNVGPVILHRTLIEALTIDAMVLADEIETYFGGDDLAVSLASFDVARQAAIAHVGLKLATRINRLVAWLVRGDHANEPPPEALELSEPFCSDKDANLLSPPARALAGAANELFTRVRVLGDPEKMVEAIASPARALQASLAERLGLVRP